MSTQRTPVPPSPDFRALFESAPRLYLVLTPGWLYSEPGKGTTFKIYLPRAAQAAEVTTQAAAPASPQSGTETILLVEDEAPVRKVAAEILESVGYRVLAAESPHKALMLLEHYSVPIQLPLSDVIMPNMNGRELAEQVLAKRADMKVLFMSGYTDDVILHHGVLDSGVAFLQKPLTPDALTRKVRQVLGSGC